MVETSEPTGTESYYDDHADEFFEASIEVDMAPLYADFLKHLKPGDCILDAGCGSGRDTLAFHRMGYAVEAFDASPALVDRARKHTGCHVELRRFEDLDVVDRYHGIWACASLLHVPEPNLPDAFGRLSRALVPDGLMYVSFKFGEGPVVRGSRSFVDFTPESLRAFVLAKSTLGVMEIWETTDVRPERKNERWTNALLQRHSLGGRQASLSLGR